MFCYREVISAFRSSALALKDLLSGDNSADTTADTMDQLQQVSGASAAQFQLTVEVGVEWSAFNEYEKFLMNVN